MMAEDSIGNTNLKGRGMDSWMIVVSTLFSWPGLNLRQKGDCRQEPGKLAPHCHCGSRMRRVQAKRINGSCLRLQGIFRYDIFDALRDA